ncbi:pyruvate formate lyase-activating protein [Bacillus timonensis]|nr:pyruvate formate lyase-activating protein [Bacillus timonensis]
MKGRIHSVETCGTVDGPGLRYIVFTQGCLLRCAYCHNPDTWDQNNGKEISVDEIIEDLKAYLPFIKASNGGITVSGGEPLLQLDFLYHLFKACKELGIHTAIDTSGGCFHEDEIFLQKLSRVLALTDLVLLDIKQINSDKHKRLTGKQNGHILSFARLLSKKEVPVWIRHVLVPGLTDSVDDLQQLRLFIDGLPNVEKVEILPYHQLGVYKWHALGLSYPLEHVSPPTEEQVLKASNILIKA